MKTLVLLAVAVSLTGCGTIFENRVACTLDGKHAVFLSKYGAVSVGAQIAKDDADVLCAIAVINGVTSVPPKPAVKPIKGDDV